MSAKMVSAEKKSSASAKTTTGNKPTNGQSIFFTDSEAPESFSLRNQFVENLEFRLIKSKISVNRHDVYTAMALAIRDRLVRRWIRTKHQYAEQKAKRVYYLSLEFLMGRLLEAMILNSGYYTEAETILSEHGFSLQDIINEEHDMGLGNGGLGRLASCFLDSMATMHLPAIGYGIRYQYGIFEQFIDHGYQVEQPDNWLEYGCPWEIIRPELTYRVQFGGQIVPRQGADGLEFAWVDTNDVLAVAYDVPVPGYNNNTVNNLRLWQARATHNFNLSLFNQGDYMKAVEQKSSSETISKVLYPNDTTASGKYLRLQQQYFFVCASLQDIMRKYNTKGVSMDDFAKYNAIQLNDTHPSLAIPELMRVLIDDKKMEWQHAWEIAHDTFGYTNHTVLGEALERWSVSMFERLLPRHLQIIYEINQRFIDKAKTYFHNDIAKVARMSIIEEGSEKMVRMANLSIIGSHAVNGVAALHTQILKDDLFADFHAMMPEKIQNKTNGITQRRWLRVANPPLADLITKHIGDEWTTNLYALKRLEPLATNTAFHEEWTTARSFAKRKLADYIQAEYGITINQESMIDSQIKRFHEYKRQLLNVLHVITLYNRIKANPTAHYTPRTVIFSGKAAPGYVMAKLIIKLINAVANTVNNDPDIGDKLKVVFMRNYSVTLAGMIIPASDLSEQTSTAGFEASGTGNMKFQLNGALTIGTMDGANVEMREELGDDNIIIFGLTVEGIEQLKTNGYAPYRFYENNPALKQVLDMINDDYFNQDEPGIFRPLIYSLLTQGDKYFLLADYQSYVDAQDKAAKLFQNRTVWTTKSILNTARSGKFSSDRTIQQYADDIWNVKPIVVHL